MLTHPSSASKPSRAVLLGGRSFIGSTIASLLEKRGIPVLSLGRQEVDLLDPQSADLLKQRLQPADTLLFVAAMAPCKNGGMLEKNVAMANNVCRALQGNPVSHLLYISSDAVYQDSDAPMSEEAFAAPASVHGAMHLARELILQSDAGAPLAILRPTLVYGARDPHNGYGPNRFIRLAAQGEKIVLFGEGEERRDHVAVGDVAELAARIVERRSTGTLNAVTGVVASFREMAEYASSLHGHRSVVEGTPRQGGMPHNGYRAFTTAGVAAAFPDFRFTPWKEGLKRMAAEI